MELNAKQRARGGHPRRVSVEPSQKNSTVPIVPRPASLPLTRHVTCADGLRIGIVGTSIGSIGLGFEENKQLRNVAFLSAERARELAAYLVEVADDLERNTQATEWAAQTYQTLRATSPAT